ncbi:MAG: ATP-binding protein [Candidatus Micrarchaeota archaeon]|nr:ATP-binding protein [Candidatus Micrarchaeota archaeon]
MDFEKYGKKVKKIPVRLNYRIIELFSAGLYSSPNKAFEELVSNSYDAFASEVCIFTPQQITKNSMIVVCDNGDSMNIAELRDLWQIGESKKPLMEEKKGRLQIGQFGIGKLATYVLADKLTYLCKKQGKIHLVTMDYNSMPKKNKQKKLNLDVLQIDEDKAEKLITEVLKDFPSPKITFKLFGEGAVNTWTFAILSDIKDKGKEILSGRLRWIFSTALPVNPTFKLTFNNDPIEPSKLSGEIYNTWIIGKDDAVAKAKNYATGQKDDVYYVDLSSSNKIRGEVTLYKDTLTGGKSSSWGRSHGIFLMVRGRLINTENPLLNGMEELNHAAFNRLRFIIHADDLNTELTSGREMVKSTKKYREVKEYIESTFYKVRAYFIKKIEDEPKDTISDKILNVSPFYSKIPIYESVKKVFEGDISGLALTTTPSDISEDQKKDILAALDNEITDPKSLLVKDYSLDNDLDEDDPIAKFNLTSRKIDINTKHPFYIAFLSEFKGKTNLMFSLIASNEIFTEAALIEKGVDEQVVRDIIKRRDNLFREFSRGTKNNIFTATSFLKSSLADAKNLEKALHMCFECLGFQVEPMAGNGEPEGKATARLGVWKDGKNESYSFTYEAKSTKKDSIDADATKTGVVNIHRKKNNADYALEVAIDYEGAENVDSNANTLATDDEVTLVRAKDFWRLIICSIPNRLNFVDFRDFLKTCKKVTESEAWINKFCDNKPQKLPYKEILEATWIIMDEDPKSAPTIDTVRMKAGITKEFTPTQVTEMFNALQHMLPQLINLEGNKVRILIPPDKILETLNDMIEKQAPQELKDQLEGVFKRNLDKV